MAPLLVLVAHPDDEVIGMAGVVVHALRAGRRVFIGVATNGDAWRGRDHGLLRDAETLASARLLGVPTDDVFFLGFPDGALADLPRVRGHATYALDAAGGADGELRFRLTGMHGRATRRALVRDVAALLDMTRPADVYTHVAFDGHPDHAALARAVARAAPTGTTLHGTLMHPSGAGACLELSASRWPNPAGDSAARFVPDQDVVAPPSPPCAPAPSSTNWGPLGPPHELIAVPPEMRTAREDDNLKWQAIACHRSQLEHGPVSAGYLRAFVKRHEFFWTTVVGT